jgi:hypothetical protein
MENNTKCMNLAIFGHFGCQGSYRQTGFILEKQSSKSNKTFGLLVSNVSSRQMYLVLIFLNYFDAL